jgi:type IV pilus assembly protein PilV
MSSRRHTAGFTLLEVLVSIVVLSFGLLGIAGLQAFALKNNQGASLRSTATANSNDLIERMKTNVQGLILDEYNKPSQAAYGKPAVDCVSQACDAVQAAAYDLWQFANAAATRLPGGKVVVCRSTDMTPTVDEGTPGCNGGAAHYVVKIWWYDNRNVGSTGTKSEFITSFNP